MMVLILFNFSRQCSTAPVSKYLHQESADSGLVYEKTRSLKINNTFILLSTLYSSHFSVLVTWHYVYVHVGLRRSIRVSV